MTSSLFAETFSQSAALTVVHKCNGITETSSHRWCSADFESLDSYLLERNEKKQVFVMGILKIVVKISGKSHSS